MTMSSALYQTKHTELDFYSASSLKQVCGQTCLPTWTHFPDYQATSHCSISLMLSREATNTNFIVWLDPIRAGTHNRPNLRRVCLPIHHRCVSVKYKTKLTLWYLCSMHVKFINVSILHHGDEKKKSYIIQIKYKINVHNILYIAINILKLEAH